MTVLDHTGHEDRVTDRRRLIALSLLVLLVASAPLWLWWRAYRSSAAFADAEVLETNHLGAATLDLEVGPETVAFEATNMAPGDVVTGQLVLINAGTLPLSFELSATSDGGLLSEWLRFEVWRSESTCRPDDIGPLIASDLTLTTDSAILAGAAAGVSRDGTTLAPGARSRFCLGARLLIDAPNSVQGQTAVVDLVIDAVHDVEAEQ